MAQRYWAFVSYSHRDASWCKWLHGALETFRIPSRLVGRETRIGKVPKRLFPVFRDRAELPGSSALGQNLRTAGEIAQLLAQQLVTDARLQSVRTDGAVDKAVDQGKQARTRYDAHTLTCGGTT